MFNFNKAADLFVKALNDEYGAFNAEFNTDLQWGEFKPVLAVVTPDSDENEEWGVDSNNTEELPFSN